MKKIVFDEPKTINVHDVPLESVIAVYKNGRVFGVILNHADCHAISSNSRVYSSTVRTDLTASCKWFGKGCEFYLLDKNL